MFHCSTARPLFDREFIQVDSNHPIINLNPEVYVYQNYLFMTHWMGVWKKMSGRLTSWFVCLYNRWQVFGKGLYENLLTRRIWTEYQPEAPSVALPTLDDSIRNQRLYRHCLLILTALLKFNITNILYFPVFSLRHVSFHLPFHYLFLY